MNVIRLVNKADLEWFSSKIVEPFEPNAKLADALSKYQNLIEEKNDHEQRVQQEIS